MKENYLKRMPEKNNKISWFEDEMGCVTVKIENNRLLRMILNKPKTSYIHLDDMGSFIWNEIDGKSNLIEIGKKLSDRFGEKANPLYERLSKFFGILEGCRFISWNKSKNTDKL